MSDQDRLAEIKAQWFTDERHRAEWWADRASRDVPWLVGEIVRLRALLEPSVTMTSPHVVDPGNANEPPTP